MTDVDKVEDFLKTLRLRLAEHTVRAMKDAHENPPPPIRTFKQFADRQRQRRPTSSRRE